MTPRASHSVGIESIADLWEWVFPRLMVYLAAAAASGAVFIVGAALYAFFWSEPPRQSRPEATPEAIEAPGETVIPKGRPKSQPILDPSELIASGHNAFPASKMVGVYVFGPNNERLGKVNEIVLDRHGRAEVVVIYVPGAWYFSTGQKIAVPYESVTWVRKTEASGNSTVITRMISAPEKAIVRFSSAELRSFIEQRQNPAIQVSPPSN